MRKGEKALIAIKPKYAFGMEEMQQYLKYPPSFQSDEQKEIINRRRVYYEVKLHSW